MRREADDHLVIRALIGAGNDRRTEVVGVLVALIRKTVREQVLKHAWPGVLLDS